jgi:hypothetical protein
MDILSKLYNFANYFFMKNKLKNIQIQNAKSKYLEGHRVKNSHPETRLPTVETHKIFKHKVPI